MQIELGPAERQRIDLGEGAWIDLWPRLVRDPAGALPAALLRELPLAPETYRMLGREVTAPRLVSWHGEPGRTYVYSGVAHAPTPWTPELRAMKDRVEQATGLRFDACLANLYRDGRDSMGWHADDEPEVGPSPADRHVASLSLGAARRFVLKHRRRGEKRSFDLGDGTLLVMRGTTQTHWVHAVPKTARPVGPRLNLTFRAIAR